MFVCASKFGNNARRTLSEQTVRTKCPLSLSLHSQLMKPIITSTEWTVHTDNNSLCCICCCCCCCCRNALLNRREGGGGGGQRERTTWWSTRIDTCTMRDHSNCYTVAAAALHSLGSFSHILSMLCCGTTGRMQTDLPSLADRSWAQIKAQTGLTSDHYRCVIIKLGPDSVWPLWSTSVPSLCGCCH